MGFYSLSKPVNYNINLTSWAGCSELYISQVFVTISWINIYIWKETQLSCLFYFPRKVFMHMDHLIVFHKHGIKRRTSTRLQSGFGAPDAETLMAFFLNIFPHSVF